MYCVPYVLYHLLYCITVSAIILAATNMIVIYYERMVVHHGVDNAFLAKASWCGGRWSIPSSNWIIDDEEATGAIDFSIIIIIIIIIIFIVV